VKLHIIFALKYNKQQLLLLLDKINITSEILGGHYHVRPPFINIGGGGMSLCSIVIDAPARHHTAPYTDPVRKNRARQLYKNISMLFLFPVKDGKLSTGVNAQRFLSCYG